MKVAHFPLYVRCIMFIVAGALNDEVSAQNIFKQTKVVTSCTNKIDASFPLSYPKITSVAGFLPDVKGYIVLAKKDMTVPESYNRRIYNRIDTDTIYFEEGDFKVELALKYPIYVNFTFCFSSIVDSKRSGQDMLDVKVATGNFILVPGDAIYFDLSKYTRMVNNGRGGGVLDSANMNGAGSGRLKLYRKLNSLLIRNWAFQTPKSLSDVEQLLDSISAVIESNDTSMGIWERNLVVSDFYFSIEANPLSYVANQHLDIQSDSVRYTLNKYMRFVDSIMGPFDNYLSYSHSYLNQITSRLLMEIAMSSGERQIDTQSKFTASNFDSLQARIPNGYLKQLVLYKYLNSWLQKKSYNKDINAALSKYFKNGYQDSLFKRDLKERQLLFKESRLAVGAKAYDFSLPDTLGKFVKMSDFNGKVVLMDFMFQGCHGCHYLVPHLENMKVMFKEENVEFITITLDGDTALWRKNAVYPCAAKGSIFLYTAGEKQYHPIIKHYDISTYPRLILIDKWNRIVSVKPPDPRDDNGKELSLLIEKELKRTNATEQ